MKWLLIGAAIVGSWVSGVSSTSEKASAQNVASWLLVIAVICGLMAAWR